MISIIVPVYNTEKYLKRCIDSIMNSNYKEFELILINDGSKDGSLKICKDYARKNLNVRVIDQEHQGVSVARNRGIKESRGDWIIFVDSDDFIAPDFLETVVQKEYQDEDLLIFDYATSSWKGRSSAMYSSSPFTIRYKEEDNLMIVEKLLRCRQLMKGGHTDLRTPWAKAYRKRLIEEYDLRFPTKLTLGEDQIFHIRYQMKTRYCTYVRRPVYFIETRPDSTTQNFRKRLMEEYLLFQKYLKHTLVEEGCYSILEEAYYDAVLACMKGILVIGIFHPASSRTYLENLLLCWKMHRIPAFRIAMERYNSKAGEGSRRVLLFFFQKKCFAIVRLICRLGHIRMKLKKR